MPPGAIVDNFTRIKKETDGSASMTPEQKQWADSMRASLSGSARAPREPTHPLRRACFRLVRSQPFDYLVMAVIVANVLAMACEFEGIEDYPQYSWRFHNAMLFFSYFYYGECILKLIGLGPRNYFADRWCCFDFFLVCVSLLDQFFLELLLLFLPVPPTLLRVLRVARVLRILRLVKNLRGLRDLALTLVYAFPSLVNVGALLFVVTFIYGVLGMSLFCRVQHQENISDERNFESFGNAMLLLLQCITGDGWSAFMYDCMINEARGCDPSANGGRGDCGSRLALPYFISYTIVATFVFINLVVAVILENFTALGSLNADLVSTHDIAVRRPSENARTRTRLACNPVHPACNPAHPACNPCASSLQPLRIQDFKEAWGTYDPDADGLIPVDLMPKLVSDVRPPLGTRGATAGSRARAIRLCVGLGLHTVDGKVQFREVLDALIQANYDNNNVAVEESAVLTKEETRQRRASRDAFIELESPDDDPAMISPNSSKKSVESMAVKLARTLFCRLVQRKREYWAAHPEQHPSNRRKGDPGMTALDGRAMYSP